MSNDLEKIDERLNRVNERLDRVSQGSVAVSDNMGGLVFADMAQMILFSDKMAKGDIAIPKHLRGNVGACMAIVLQSIEWRMSPFAVANKSYSVNDRMAYESQLIHAVIEARGPLKERLRERYEGEGPTRKCIITGWIKGETEPRELATPEVQNIKVKNSPLWASDPDQQLFYYASRAWARRHCPDVLLGIYSKDELEAGENIAETAQNITPVEPNRPNLKERLTGAQGKRGFSADNVKSLDHQPGQRLPVTDVLEATGAKETVTVAQEQPEPARAQAQAAVSDAAEITEPTESAEAPDHSATIVDHSATMVEAAAEPAPTVSQNAAPEEAPPPACAIPGLEAELKALAECTGVQSVDRLENEVGARLKDKPELLHAFVDACAARAKELMAKTHPPKAKTTRKKS